MSGDEGDEPRVICGSFKARQARGVTRSLTATFTGPSSGRRGCEAAVSGRVPGSPASAPQADERSEPVGLGTVSWESGDRGGTVASVSPGTVTHTQTHPTVHSHTHKSSPAMQSLHTHTHTDHPGNPGAWRSCQQQDQTQKDSLPFRQERLESSEASKLCRGTAAPREGPFWQRGAQGPRVANTSERRLGGRVPAAPTHRPPDTLRPR